MKPLFLITGATGSIGGHYYRHCSGSGIGCIGFSRTHDDFRRADLYDPGSIADALRNLPEAENVVYMHGVGRWDFERYPPEEPDPAFYQSNVTTFLNFMGALAAATPARITACAFGSIADTRNVRYYRSSSAAKRALREKMHAMAYGTPPVRGVFVNISTFDSPRERERRPCAKTTYWLQPEKLIAETMPLLLADEPRWQEVDVFDPMPGFTEEYFRDDVVLARRLLEQG